MKGEWVQAAGGTWHLIWRKYKEGRTITTWCHRDFLWDEPTKPGDQIEGFIDILHDECVRKSEEL